MDRSALCRAGVLAYLMLAPTAVLAQAAASPSAQVPALAQSTLRLAQSFAQGCSRRIGPFATQSTAWRKWRDARGQGYAVSAGVFPCENRGAKGYCFNILYRC